MKAQVNQNDYDKSVAKQFCNDMEDAGFDVFHYHGRFFWEGPAVVCGDLQEVIRATEIPLQWDSMGFDYVIYPKERAKLNENDS